MQPFERLEHFRPPSGEVVVSTLAARCDNCGAETVLPSQMAENIARRRTRQAQYGSNLLGEDILAFRRKYGLSQPAASKVFGKGKIAFSRYENEKTFPDDSTTKLLRVAMTFPDVLKHLADEAQVEIPLWSARSAEVKDKVVRQFRVVEQEDTLDFDPALPSEDEPTGPSLQAAVG